MIDEALARVVRVAVHEEADRLLDELRRLLANEMPRRPKDGEALLTATEVAEMLKVRVGTVRAWVRRGLLRPVALGMPGARQTIRVRRSELERFLAERERKPVRPLPKMAIGA